MIESIFNYLSDLLSGNFRLATFSAFVWGLLSIILNLCHLSSFPLIVGFLSSQGEISLKRTFNLSLVFAFGILVTIAIIGGIILGLGRLMGDVGLLVTILLQLCSLLLDYICLI